jgi:hypothetical protein
VIKTGLWILAFGVLILLFPLWETIDLSHQKKLDVVPYAQQMKQLKTEERGMVEADPESPRLLELKERQKEVFDVLVVKNAEYNLARRKMWVTLLVMLVALLVGTATTLVGFYLSYAYHAQFAPKAPPAEEEKEE